MGKTSFFMLACLACSTETSDEHISELWERIANEFYEFAPESETSPILTSQCAVLCFPLYARLSLFSVFSLIFSTSSHGKCVEIFPQKFMYTLFYWPSLMQKW